MITRVMPYCCSSDLAPARTKQYAKSRLDKGSIVQFAEQFRQGLNVRFYE
jgi:hypothetical protein